MTPFIRTPGMYIPASGHFYSQTGIKWLSRKHRSIHILPAWIIRPRVGPGDFQAGGPTNIKVGIHPFLSFSWWLQLQGFERINFDFHGGVSASHLNRKKPYIAITQPYFNISKMLMINISKHNFHAYRVNCWLLEFIKST